MTKPEDKISCNGIELEKVEAGSGGEYVYDVYYHRRHPAIKAGEFEIFSPDCIDQVRRGSEKFCFLKISILIMTVSAQFNDKLIKVNNFLFCLRFSFIQLLEESIHMFVTKFEIILNFLDPLLIHFIKIVFY